MRVLIFSTLILLLAACGGRPHPIGYYELVKIDDSLKKENQLLLAQIALASQIDTGRVDTAPRPTGNTYEKRSRLGKAITDMSRYIRNIQIEIFNKVDANYDSQASMMGLKDMRNPGNTDVTTYYFIGDDPERVNGKAKELKEKLVQLRELLKQLTDNKVSAAALKRISVEDEITPWNGKKQSWEVARFYQANAAEAYVELTKLENAVLVTGSEVMSLLEADLYN